jgi:hypothetical protein
VFSALSVRIATSLNNIIVLSVPKLYNENQLPLREISEGLETAVRREEL